MEQPTFSWYTAYDPRSKSTLIATIQKNGTIRLSAAVKNAYAVANQATSCLLGFQQDENNYYLGFQFVDGTPIGSYPVTNNQQGEQSERKRFGGIVIPAGKFFSVEAHSVLNPKTHPDVVGKYDIQPADDQTIYITIPKTKTQKTQAPPPRKPRVKKEGEKKGEKKK